MATPDDQAATVAGYFPARLRELREQAGLSRPGLAERSGVNTRTIEAYEQGRNAPTWEAVLRLAFALGQSPAAFAAVPSPTKYENSR